MTNLIENYMARYNLTAAVVVTAVCCLLLLPTAAFIISSPTRKKAKQLQQQRRHLSKSDGVCERRSDGMPILPSDVVKYTQVPSSKPNAAFTATTIPSGLTKQHTTKRGTWGIIRVKKGKLEYTIHKPNESVHILDKEHPGVIEPTMLHQVKALSDDLEFVVEFWRVPGTGKVDEKREGL